MRRKNKMDMTVTEQINEIGERVCREICKYYKDGKDMSDEEYEQFAQEHCLHCPIGEL